MNKTIIYSILGLSLLLCVLFVLQVSDWMTPSTTSTQTEQPAFVPSTDSAATTETFVSPHTGETITVSFAGDTATLTNDTYAALELTQVEAASGARYEDSATGVTLWNKGAEVTLYQDEVVTFIGQTEASLGQPDPSGADVRLDALRAHPWVWNTTQMNDDTVVTPKQPEAFTLTFGADGRVSGTTDCNGFGGSYTVNDGVLTMGPFMMTKMYCEGSQEMEFQKVLSEPVTFMFTDAGELVLMLPYDSGSVIFTPQF